MKDKATFTLTALLGPWCDPQQLEQARRRTSCVFDHCTVGLCEEVALIEDEGEMAFCCARHLNGHAIIKATPDLVADLLELRLNQSAAPAETKKRSRESQPAFV